MELNLKCSSFKLYFRLDEEFSALLEQEGLSYAAARQLSKLAVAQLRSLKKSIASMSRSYFPEYDVQNILKHVNKVKKNLLVLTRPLLNELGILGINENVHLLFVMIFSFQDILKMHFDREYSGIP